MNLSIKAALILTGRYDLPEKLTVSGFDAYGNPVTETVPAIDHERLNADVERLERGGGHG